MSSFFPSAMPDEHLFSVFARYHQIAGNSTIDRTKAQFGLAAAPLKPQDISNQTFHKALETAATMLKQPLSKVALSHTLIPLLRLSLPFKAQDQQHTTWENSESSIPAPRTLMNDRMLTFDKSWRFCNECIKTDTREVGFCYWHLSHQIPSIRRCKLHQAPLSSSGLKTLNDFQLPGSELETTILKSESSAQNGWECWLFELFASCQASNSSISLGALTATFENVWGVPRKPGWARAQRYQEILSRVEDVASMQLLETIFEFYQGDGATYRGRRRPNFIRTTFESRDPKIRHPIYYLLPLWAAGLSPNPNEWLREL